MHILTLLLTVAASAVALVRGDFLGDDALAENASSVASSHRQLASCSIQSGVDHVGSDLTSVTAAAATDCCAQCSAQSGCGAFTWTNWNGGTCWLKRSKGTTVTNAGAQSAEVAAVSSATSCTTETGVDYVGNDVGNAAAAAATECCAKCSARSGCGAFTWTAFNGGTCWLKSGKGTVKALAGAVSGAMSPPTTSPTATTPSPTPSTHIQSRLRSGEIPLRSVNLGSWLVSEYWMSFTSPAWNDTNGVGWDGEYVTMQTLGKDKGTRQFEQHRATWITETDIAQIAAAGMNAVRVPVGFWIVNDDLSTVATDISRVYAPGSLKYLDLLINGWAIKYNLAVMLSLHAHQGSQNGYDHSAPQVYGAVTWSDSQANVDNSLQFATFLAARYKNSAAFLGMNLMNEPMYPTDYGVLQNYYTEAYKRIRATGNDCILAVSPLLWDQAPPTMMDFMRWPQYYNVWHEFHTYYKWGYEGKIETQIMDAARPYRQTNLDPWTGNWVFMGEWSLAAPDSAPFQDKELLRQYAAIQLTNYAAAHSGWAFWSWRHDQELTQISGWSLRQLLREGIFTIPKVN